VGILGPYGNKLGNTTRHFILYGEFIFLTKWDAVHFGGNVFFSCTTRNIQSQIGKVHST
jgi:hypothetical protein